MKIIFKILSILTIIITVFNQSTAQIVEMDQYRDVVKLKNGLIVKCSIISFDEKKICIEKTDKSSVCFLMDECKVLVQSNASKIVKFAESQLGEKRWFTTLDFGFSVGGVHQYIISGAGFDVGVKYCLSSGRKHFLRSALFTHFHKIEFESSFTEYRNFGATIGYQYHFTKNRSSPYVFFDIGKPMAKNLLGFRSALAKNDLLFSAGIGVLFNTNSHILRVNAAYINQNIGREYNSVFSDDANLSRLMVRVGIDL